MYNNKKKMKEYKKKNEKGKNLSYFVTRKTYSQQAVRSVFLAHIQTMTYIPFI